VAGGDPDPQRRRADSEPQGRFQVHRFPPAFFRGAGFLDYEAELGLVIGADLPVGTTVTDEDRHLY
jgi:2-keto-4-pentenoate hydratase/2-oxohepta-3-ene-1,7-dioic acid hydratase in catechol pathway